MKSQMDKYTIITLKKKGWSNREISRELSIDRKTVAKFLKEFADAQKVIAAGSPVDENQIEHIIDGIKYNSSNRTKRKLTLEIRERVLEILDGEDKKNDDLGHRHKQKLSITQIHEMIREEGFDIGQTTIRNFVHDIRESRETYIRQNYHYGHRLEFDFGEVKLHIGGKLKTLYLAVFTSPASGYRYAYLYDNQKQKVFIDAHVRFFRHTNGSWKEVVYDNMRNVVKRFITRFDKEITEECLKLALYYDFEINLTNIRSGNEKGSVENSVKVIRNRVFARHYKFETLDDATKYLEAELVTINKYSTFSEERSKLQPSRVPYEFADIEIYTVDKYGCIQVETNFYSVPDYLTAKRVTVKNGATQIRIYTNQTFVCEHKKIDGHHQYQLVLEHYLNTMTTKPGALKNSLVLQQHPQLYDIYHNHYKTRTKEFIEILQKNRDQSHEIVVDALKYCSSNPAVYATKNEDSIQDQSRRQLQIINQLMN